MKDNIKLLTNSILLAGALIALFVVLTPKHINVMMRQYPTISTIYCPIIDRKGTTPVHAQNIIFSKIHKDMDGDTRNVKSVLLKGGTVIDCYSETILSPEPEGVLYEAHVQAARFVNKQGSNECIAAGHNCSIQVESY